MNPVVIEWRPTRKALREGGDAFAKLEALLHWFAARRRTGAALPPLLLWGDVNTGSPDTVLRSIIMLGRDMGSINGGVIPEARRTRLVAFTRALYDATSPEQRAMYFWCLEDSESEYGFKPMTWALFATLYAGCPELVALLLEHCGCRFNAENDRMAESHLIHRLALNGQSGELRVIAKYVSGCFAPLDEVWGRYGSALFCAARGGHVESASVLLSHYYGTAIPRDLSIVVEWLEEQREKPPQNDLFHETTDQLLELLTRRERLVHVCMGAKGSDSMLRLLPADVLRYELGDVVLGEAWRRRAP